MLWLLCTIVTLGYVAVTIAKWRGKRTPAFLTGSRAYGDAYRTPASDYDLVMFVNDDTFEDLKALGQEEWNEVSDRSRYFGTRKVKSLRIKHGGLDLIILKDVSDYQAWQKTTRILMLDKPATRDEAKETFKRLGTVQDQNECNQTRD